jgi:hypothetical protein
VVLCVCVCVWVGGWVLVCVCGVLLYWGTCSHFSSALCVREKNIPGCSRNLGCVRSVV